MKIIVERGESVVGVIEYCIKNPISHIVIGDFEILTRGRTYQDIMTEYNDRLK